jgi:hypothetical protein
MNTDLKGEGEGEGESCHVTPDNFVLTASLCDRKCKNKTYATKLPCKAKANYIACPARRLEIKRRCTTSNTCNIRLSQWRMLDRY